MTQKKVKTLNVAVLTRLFPNIVQTYILNHITALINYGVNTTIIAERNPNQTEVNPAVEQYNLTNKTIYVPKKISTLVEMFTDKTYRSLLWKISSSSIWSEFGIKYTFQAFFRTATLSRSNCQLIHSHSLFSTYNFIFSKKYLSIPLITTYHGMVPRGVNKLGQEKMNVAIDETDIFIVNTNYAKSELIGLGCSEEKIRIIPQGTDLEKFKYFEHKITRGKPIVLLTVARLSAEKGHLTALQAISKLINDFPEIEYHIVGHGPEKSTLEKQAIKLKIEKHVHMHDFMTGDNLLQMFTNAHIFILPSINLLDGFLVETQGVVLQEAQASGTPIIGSNAGGIPDVITDHETGLIFEQENDTQLAEKISLLIDDSSLYNKLGKAGRKDVQKRFNIPVVYKQLLSIYNEIFTERHNRN